MMERGAKRRHRQIDLKIGTATAGRGEKAWGGIPTTANINGNAVTIPVGLACGMKTGKTLLLVAGQHGGELNGMEVIRRTFDGVDTKNLRGRLVVLPVANPPLIKYLRNAENPRWLEEAIDVRETNMNRVWPGKRNGNVVERMAYAMSRMFSEVDCIIDFHTWSSQYPAAIIRKGSADSLRLARHSGIGAVALAEADWANGRDLAGYAPAKLGIPAMAVELPENRVLTEKNIQLGLRVVQNTMRHLKMLPGKPKPNPEQFFITYCNNFHDVRVTEEGLFVPLKDLGEMVEKGDLLGRIYSLDTFRPVQDLFSPVSGVLFAFSEYDVDRATNILRHGERAALVYELAEPASGHARTPRTTARRKTRKTKA